MRIAEMNWMMVEKYLTRDDRCVSPLGSTELNAYLSLSVDSIWRSRSACRFSSARCGIRQCFRAFPGIYLTPRERSPRMQPLSDRAGAKKRKDLGV
jgi:hypothetical protein